MFPRGLADFDCLSPEEQMQFTVVLLEIFTSANAAHTSHRNSLLPDEEWRREWGILRFYLRSNGGRRVWEGARTLSLLSASVGKVPWSSGSLLSMSILARCPLRISQAAVSTRCSDVFPNPRSRLTPIRSPVVKWRRRSPWHRTAAAF